MAYQLPQLPFAYDALEPYVDAKTAEIHYSKHHQTYVNNLNATLEGNSLGEQPVEELLKNIKDVPENIRQAVINNGGGHANHSMFWSLMTANETGEILKPRGDVAKAIEKDLGGFDTFCEAFTKAALSRFGSGWAWLSVTPEKKLVVESSANQDSPLSNGNTPVLTLDVWEHAYYLKYQNRRADHIKAFYHVINWAEVECRFQAAV